MVPAVPHLRSNSEMDPFPDHVTAISTANSQDKRKATATSVLALLRLIELAPDLQVAETEDRTLILQMHQTETKADDSLIAINHLLSRLPCLA